MHLFLCPFRSAPFRAKIALWCCLWMGISLLGKAQTTAESPTPEATNVATEKERPNQYNAFKLNLGQLAINEARFLYEMQVGAASSLEFGLGYIYAQEFWFERGGEPLLASGFGLYASFRKYKIQQRYFSESFFTPYFSPIFFYRNTSYKDEWILFSGGTAADSECARYNRTFHQIGTAIRFGWQTTQGRVVLDLYGGLGVKFVPSLSTRTAYNTGTDICTELPSTDYTPFEEDLSETNIILQAGIKLGLRRGNRDKDFGPAKLERSDRPSENPPPAYHP